MFPGAMGYRWRRPEAPIDIVGRTPGPRAIP